MTTGIRPEVERFVREADVQPTCGCAASKCGAHRCWPSRVLGVSLLVALLWGLYLASSLWHERRTESAQARTQLLEDYRHALTAHQETSAVRQVEWETRIRQWLDEVSRSLVSRLGQLEAEARAIRWEAKTPQERQIVELFLRLEALERQ